MRWRSPDLQELIEYLSHPNDATKANAAAYLTHLSFMDDNIKGKIRGMDGIPLLVDLLNNEYHEVHKNACGALKNLSYGKNNNDNKVSIYINKMLICQLYELNGFLYVDSYCVTVDDLIYSMYNMFSMI